MNNYDIPEVKKTFDNFTDGMDKAIDSMKAEFLTIRAGRANPHILDKITVDAYGMQTPLNQVGNISIPEARVLVVSVWDASLLKAVEKALIAANLGINPNNDGKVIRLVFPELTGERRKELVKSIKTMAESTKVAVRNERRTINEVLKKMEKSSDITEDDLKVYEKDVEKLLNAKIESIDKITKDKEAEILEI